MTIYVDPLLYYPHVRGDWCHMMTDGELEELHDFAVQIGHRRERFQNKPGYPHYDLTPTLRKAAVEHGAIEVSSMEMIERCARPDERRR